MGYTIGVPAYGREYTTAKAVKADWDNGKDFVICNMHDEYDGKPFNKADASMAGHTSVQLRYGLGNRKLIVVQI